MLNFYCSWCQTMPNGVSERRALVWKPDLLYHFGSAQNDTTGQETRLHDFLCRFYTDGLMNWAVFSTHYVALAVYYVVAALTQFSQKCYLCCFWSQCFNCQILPRTQRQTRHCAVSRFALLFACLLDSPVYHWNKLGRFLKERLRTSNWKPRISLWNFPKSICRKKEKKMTARLAFISMLIILKFQ